MFFSIKGAGWVGPNPQWIIPLFFFETVPKAFVTTYNMRKVLNMFEYQIWPQVNSVLFAGTLLANNVVH